MINIIAFDADDTLWHNEHLYHDAKVTLTKILATLAACAAALQA